MLNPRRERRSTNQGRGSTREASPKVPRMGRCGRPRAYRWESGWSIQRSLGQGVERGPSSLIRTG